MRGRKPLVQQGPFIDLLNARGLTMKELAASINEPVHKLYRLVDGRFKRAYAEYVSRIATALSMSKHDMHRLIEYQRETYRLSAFADRINEVAEFLAARYRPDDDTARAYGPDRATIRKVAEQCRAWLDEGYRRPKPLKKLKSPTPGRGPDQS